MVLLTSLVLIVPGLGGCDIPRDPQGTLDRVQNGNMRVGVISGSSPWAHFEDGRPSGIEVELIKLFAKELNADIEWVPGNESRLFNALQEHQLDLVIGGVTKDAPWQTHAAFTNTYIITHVIIGRYPDGEPVEELDGRTVLVQPASSAVGIIQDKGGKPLEIDNLENRIPVILQERSSSASDPVLVAAESWQIKRWGLTSAGMELDKSEHALATALGENGFLVRLEKFLYQKRDQVGAMLQAKAGS